MEIPRENIAPNLPPFPGHIQQPAQNGLTDNGQHFPPMYPFPNVAASERNYSPDPQMHQIAGHVQKMNLGPENYRSDNPPYSFSPSTAPYAAPAYSAYSQVSKEMNSAYSFPVPPANPAGINPATSEPASYQLGLNNSPMPPQFVAAPATVPFLDSSRSNSPVVNQLPPKGTTVPSGMIPEMEKRADVNAVPPGSMPPLSSSSERSPSVQSFSSVPQGIGNLPSAVNPPPPMPQMPGMPTVPLGKPPQAAYGAGGTQFKPNEPNYQQGPYNAQYTAPTAAVPPCFPPGSAGPYAPASVPTFPAAPSAGSGATFPPAFPASMGPPAPPMDALSGGPGAGQKRLDPNMMPSLIQVIEDDRKARGGLFQTGFDHAEQPPLCTTDFFAEDQGNCNPKFVRATLYNAPISNDFLKQSALPFGLSITPMANLSAEERPLPIVNMGELGPVRCHRCKAYMCPFMTFFDGGRRFRCPFCSVSTEVPEQYFSHLDHTGRRIDANERPELHLGSYEYVATKEYCKDGIWPQSPVFMFMLDVSYNAVRSGLLNKFCQNIKFLLHNLPAEHGKESAIEVAFVTYDSSIHFYEMKKGMEAPKMLIVNDVQEVFVPVGKNLFVRPSEAGAIVDQLTEKIMAMFGENKVTEVVLGPVLQAGVETLKAYGRAGKLFVFHTSLPTLEAPGKLKSRDDRKFLGTDKEKTVLTPQGDFYEKLGEECVSAGCCVDVFLFPNSHVDVATISAVCCLTGGQLYRYPYFEAEIDGDRFLADLKHNLERPIIFDAIMRVRTSQGLRPTEFFGNFYMNNATDVEMAALDSDKCISIEIKHDDKLEPGNAYFQVAVLFTSVTGQRRLRIHNLALVTAPDFAALYRSADLFTMINLLSKQAERMQLQKSPKDVRDSLISRSAQTLATYRQKCSPSSSLGQLVLPEAMKLLPLFINCMFKSDSFSGGSELTVDDRAWLMHIIPSMTVAELVNYFYPHVISVLNLESSREVATGMRCLYENLSPDNAYLLNNGVVLFLWVGANVQAQWVQDVFGVNSFAQINVDKHHLPEKDNPTSRTLRCLVEEMQATRQRRLKLFIVKQQDRMESWFKKFLVEDRADSHPSYVEFLCLIHKEIRSLLA
uniref:Protein transport protein Sec24C n=1 Tax=Trichuris muris TaxID=70415 RepID=A0A5S6R393_TRIMR